MQAVERGCLQLVLQVVSGDERGEECISKLRESSVIPRKVRLSCGICCRIPLGESQGFPVLAVGSPGFVGAR